MDMPVRVDPDSNIAPHEQVRLQLLALVALRRLAPGDALPTPDDLSRSTGLTTADVREVYANLERCTVLVREPGGRVAVASSPSSVTELRVAAVELVRAARESGLDDEQVLELVHTALLGPVPTAAPATGAAPRAVAPLRAVSETRTHDVTPPHAMPPLELLVSGPAEDDDDDEDDEDDEDDDLA